jgi:hypothetical protein
MKYVDIHRLPVVLIYRRRVLKAEIFSEPALRVCSSFMCFFFQRGVAQAIRGPWVGKTFHYYFFHVAALVTLGAWTNCLQDIWKAQGRPSVWIRRSTDHPRKMWDHYLDLKKEEWKSVGIMVSPVQVRI